VVAAGRYSVAPQQRVVAVSEFADQPAGASTVDVIGVGAGFYEAVGARLEPAPPPVAPNPIPGVVVSEAVLTRLRAGPGEMILLGGRLHPVVATLEDSGSFPQAQLAVLVDERYFDAAFAGAAFVESGVTLRVAPGGAAGIAAVAPVVLRPDAASALRAVAAGDPARLRASVESDLGTFALAAVALGVLAATFGIANVLLVSTMQRRPEFGLRRALGAKSSAIVLQVLVEAVLTGLLGGLVGSALGTLIVVVWSEVQGWVAVLSASTILLGLVVGVAATAAGSLLPAVLAGRVQPADALRSS
jgi:putative ABC transport system permease protein